MGWYLLRGSHWQIKEGLHIIIMALLFEIITLYSLIARLMTIRRRTIGTYFYKPKLSIYKTIILMLRELPIWNVAQGPIGDSLILSEGNPHVGQCYCTKNTIECISHAKFLGYSVLYCTLISYTLDYHSHKFPFSF